MIQYAEHGEDIFLFDWIAKNKPNITRLIVDIGAYDGQFFSNSCAFIEAGWYGVLVEPHPESFAALKDRHKDNSRVTALNVAIAESNEPCYLTKENHPTHSKVTEIATGIMCNTWPFFILYGSYSLFDIGILSIDAEGKDTQILKDALECVKPEIIIIESNTTEDRNDQIDILSDDYTLINVMGVNTIWAKK